MLFTDFRKTVRMWSKPGRIFGRTRVDGNRTRSSREMGDPSTCLPWASGVCTETRGCFKVSSILVNPSRQNKDWGRKLKVCNLRPVKGTVI